MKPHAPLGWKRQTASGHTREMIGWMGSVGVDRFDLAVHRADGAFLAGHSRNLSACDLERYLGWARAENAHGAEVYVRPARGYAWPLLLLDDTPPHRAVAIARKYGALVVRTSTAGGCYMWLRVERALDETERCSAQRYLQPLVGADPGSISGEHWGRLAGFRNNKRGEWVGVVAISHAPAWRPSLGLAQGAQVSSTAGKRQQGVSNSHGRDESVAEFAWCAHALRAGRQPHAIEAELGRRAHARGKRNPADYARRTVRRALERLSSEDHFSRA